MRQIVFLLFFTCIYTSTFAQKRIKEIKEEHYEYGHYGKPQIVHTKVFKYNKKGQLIQKEENKKPSWSRSEGTMMTSFRYSGKSNAPTSLSIYFKNKNDKKFIKYKEKTLRSSRKDGQNITDYSTWEHFQELDIKTEYDIDFSDPLNAMPILYRGSIKGLSKSVILENAVERKLEYDFEDVNDFYKGVFYYYGKKGQLRLYNSLLYKHTDNGVVEVYECELDHEEFIPRSKKIYTQDGLLINELVFNEDSNTSTHYTYDFNRAGDWTKREADHIIKGRNEYIIAPVSYVEREIIYY